MRKASETTGNYSSETLFRQSDSKARHRLDRDVFNARYRLGKDEGLSDAMNEADFPEACADPVALALGDVRAMDRQSGGEDPNGVMTRDTLAAAWGIESERIVGPTEQEGSTCADVIDRLMQALMQARQR